MKAISTQLLLVMALPLALALAAPATASDVSQEDIEALERDLARAQEDEARDELLGMLMEGLVARCFPEDPEQINPIVRDDWSKRGLTRAIEVAQEVIARPDHDDRSRALFIAGKSSIALKRPKEGRAFLEQFLEEFADSEEAPLALCSLGEMDHDAKDYPAAIPRYRAALEDLAGSSRVMPLYRLAWCLEHDGQLREAAETMAQLLQLGDDLGTERRDAARADLEAFLVAHADGGATVQLSSQTLASDASTLASSVAGALMAAKSYSTARQHYIAMLAAWPDDGNAPLWQIALVDAALADGDHEAAQQAVQQLMERFGPTSTYMEAHERDAGMNRTSFAVEESARSAIGKLHQQATPSATPPPAYIEALYRTYLTAFEGSHKAYEMNMALVSLYEQRGDVERALDEMLAIVEREGGRERGAQTARMALELLHKHLPETAAQPPGPFEQRLIQLAETFARRYPRHGDGAKYLALSGKRLAASGQADGQAMLLQAVQAYPTAPEAKLAAALVLENELATESWATTIELADELLANRSLVGAFPDLEAVLVASRMTALFNQATEAWEAGDAAGAAALFEQVAGEETAGALIPGAMLNAASCHAESGDATKSALLLRRLYTRHPDSELVPAALEQEAYLKWEKEDYSGAARIYRKLATDHPDHERAAFALYTAAALYDQEGLFDQAIECYRELLQRYAGAPECAEAKPRLDELTAE